MTERLVFTIGHSTRSVDELAALAKGNGVETIADVRRFPRSKRQPQFARDRLAESLPARGIAFRWLGEDLGGFRSGGYEAHTSGDAFARGLVTLEKLGSEHATAIMCAERDPAGCHRRFIARALVARGWRVMHIIDAGHVTEEPPTLSL